MNSLDPDLAQAMAPAMALALQASFGSAERWREDLLALAAQHPGTAGGAVLAFEPHEGRLVNRWTRESTEALLALETVTPVAIAGIVWAEVYERYQAAVHAASEALAAEADELARALVLDVRRDAMFAKADAMLPGAVWRDPAWVGEWVAELPRDREVIVYCIYGHEVGRSTALRLRAAGLEARYLAGGIEAWTQAGRPLQAKAPDQGAVS